MFRSPQKRIGNACLFAFVLTTEQVPRLMSQSITELGLPPWAFLDRAARGLGPVRDFENRAVSLVLLGALS